METGWILKEIGLSAGGKIYGESQISITILAFDSRTVIPGGSTLFIALSGKHHDGHQFIQDLYNQGVRAFMVSRLPDLSSYPEAGFCLVENTLTGLQKLATARRRAFRGEVAAVTGSNGKTIVKEWIYQIMNGTFQIHRSPKSYNSQLGVPLSIWMIQEHHELAVIEAGISLPGEMEILHNIISPDIGLFTHLGTAHQENFQSMEQKLAEKLKLFNGCRRIVYRSDAGNPMGELLLKGLEETGAELVDWSTEGEATYLYVPHEKDSQGMIIAAKTPSGDVSFRLPFNDNASLENALNALTFSLEMGLPLEEAVVRVESLEPVSMRMEILQGINGSTLINDTYNSDIGGLAASLDMLNQQEQHLEKILILSDLLQSGLEDHQLYREISGLINQKGVTRFIGIGPALMTHRNLFPPNSTFYHDTEAFLKRCDRTLFRDASVLIKGSRRFGFERISSDLQLKSHQTMLEIDLNAMVSNLAYYRSLLHDGVKIMVMVKALSYGSGSVEIANLLQYHKVDYLAVAFIDEGVELRKAGIHLPIMVLNPDQSGYPQMIDFNLEPEVYNLKGLEGLHQILHYREISQYPIHIKLDSGMHRLGFPEDELDDVLPLIKRKEFRVASVFTHLAASNEPEHDSFSQKQKEVFNRASARLSDAVAYPVCRHMLNSAGIERFPDAQYQMVRLGIGLHGIGHGKQLTPSSSYVSTISQVRLVKKGETIGYSRRGKAESDRLVATLPVGYADGMDRRLGNGVGSVWIKGAFAPTIGNICMDMTMIDVTGMEVVEGDQVELFGKNLTVNEVASNAGTIPYEILTSIPERVKRVYLQE